MSILFYVSVCIALVSALMVVTRKNAVHALLYLVVMFFSIAVLFYIVGAPFVAVMEIIIYAGAIVTLFVFVVMMLNMGAPLSSGQRRWMRISVWLPPVLLIAALLAVLLIIITRPLFLYREPSMIDPYEVGYALMTRYMLAVELAGMLLMAGIIGAYHLGKRKKKVLHRYLEKLNQS